MIKVGILSNNHYPNLGGMEFANHFLAKSLNGHVDCSVSVACGSLKGVPEDFYYPYSCYRAKSFSYLSQYLHLVNQKKMIKNEQINILHGAAFHEGGYQAINLSKKMDIPFVAQSHGSDVQFVPDAGYGALTFSENKTKIKSAIKFSRKIIAVSSINKKNIIDFGCEPDKIEVIHNGCQFDEIQNVPLKSMKDRYGIKPDDFVLISVGSDRSVKRIELLFKALEKLKDIKQIKCICVGPGQDFKNLAIKYDVENKVIITGKVPKSGFNKPPPFPDLINLYRASNVYVSTSYVEAFSLAAVDALASGCPIVVGKRHGVKDVLTENKNGWIMDKDTPEELTDLIMLLYKQKDALKDEKPKIIESVSHLSWDNIAKQMIDLYRRIL